MMKLYMRAKLVYEGTDIMPIIAKMPYGEVEIRTKEEAVHFIKTRCNNCQHSNEMNRCSGYQASLCESQEKLVIEHFKEHI